MTDIKFVIDGKECHGRPGQTIVEAAAKNGVYIPVLCNSEGLKPVGSCRVCTVKVGGRFAAACTQPITEGMVVENSGPEIEDLRRGLIEMLFVEGNHFCPLCEKSGNCELQGLAYRFGMTHPRFPYQWPKRETDGSVPKIIMEHNRCIQCQRCTRAIQTKDRKKIFVLRERSRDVKIGVDAELAARFTDDMAKKAMDVCPVGTILKKEVGFAVPIGRRKFDKGPIGDDIEKKEQRGDYE